MMKKLLLVLEYIVDLLKDENYRLNFQWTNENIIEWKAKIAKIELERMPTSNYIGVHYKTYVQSRSIL
jgi:hypothetical protein